MPQQHADLLDQSGQTVESTGDQSPGPDKAFQIDCHDKGSRQDQAGTPQGITNTLLRHNSLLLTSFLPLPSQNLPLCAFFPHSRLPSFRLLPFAKAHSPHSLSFSCHTSDTTRIPTG